MSHLDGRVSALVDGRLAPDAAERAREHLVSCQTCRQAVAAERGTREALRAAPDPSPPEDLVGRLMSMGGPEGPLPPRPGRLPGTARPLPVTAQGAYWGSRRPGDGRGLRRPGRARLLRVAVGAASVATVGLAALVIVGTVVSRVPAAPPALGTAAMTTAADGNQARPTVERLERADLASLRAEGWICPAALDGGLRLVEAYRADVSGSPVLHLTYSDGSSTVTVVEQRGRLEPEQAAAFGEALTAGARMAGHDTVPWHAVWQSGDVVVAVVGDAPPEVADVLLETMPPHDVDADLWDRARNGADVVGALLTDR